jgi:hypothetical protein
LSNPLTLPTAAPPQPQCRCAPGPDGILPPSTTAHGADRTCIVCHLPRRYYVSLIVFNGGVVGVCADCEYAARSQRLPRPAATLVRSVVYTTCTAGQWRSTHGCALCDRCCDQEIVRWTAGGAEIVDGRERAPTAEAPRAD